MAFCINCGQELVDGAKFCANCGASANGINQGTQRKTTYDGEIHKCLNCGEVLNSFVTNCPSCGYEIRGTSTSNAVKEFAAQLTSAKTQQEKTSIIRNFPIPNTKEDVMEFMILASTNITNNLEPDISAAWQSKTEQAYQKTKILFQDEQELLNVENIYSQVCAKLSKRKKIENAKKAGDIIAELMPVLPNVIIVMGWLLSIFVLLPLCRVNLDNAGTNGYQLVLMFDLIAGSILIPFAFRCDSPLPKLITSLGLFLSIVVLIPLCGENLDNAGTNAFHLILILDIICSVIILIRMFKQKGNPQSSKTTLSKISFVIALACMVILLVTYGIGSIITSISIAHDNEEIEREIEEEREQELHHKQTAKFEWPISGLSTYLPVPQNEHGEIKQDDESCFKIVLYQATVNDFEDYITECKERGFTVDSTKNTNSYEAWNADGCRGYLHFSESDDELSITLYDPIKRNKINWSTVPMMKKVPTPPSNVGEFGNNFDWTVSVYVLDITYEEYEAYVDKCINKGFTVDFTRYDTWFSGENKDGYELDISWEGNNTIHIDVTNLDLM